jgi:hypothetical protein
VTAPEPCREPWPQVKGVYCTRPKGHQGGHRDDLKDRYWPAEETQS